MMSMYDFVAISVEIQRIDGKYFSEKNCIKVIFINPWMISFLIINHGDLYCDCVYGLLTWDTEYIF